MRGNGAETAVDEKDYIDADRYSQLENLIKLRFYGQYKDDLPGFIDKLRLIKNAKNYGPPALVDSIGVSNVYSAAGNNAAANNAFNEFI